jgi:hypothetical protein
LSTFRGLLSEESRFTFEEEPVLPVTEEGMPAPPSTLMPETPARFELTAEVRVPILVEEPIA